MNPHQRLSWTLTLSLLIWAPIAFSVLGNKIDFAKGGLFYLGALAFSYVGTGLIEYLTNNYRETQDSLARAKHQIERIEKRNAAEAAAPKRRAADDDE